MPRPFRPADLVFPENRVRINKGLCPTCGEPTSVGDLRDPISLREYEISGMCQACQDAVFIADDEDDDDGW